MANNFSTIDSDSVSTPFPRERRKLSVSVIHDRRRAFSAIPIPRPRRRSVVGTGFRLALASVAFILFCAAAVLALEFLLETVTITSYRLAILFVDLVVVANVTSRFLIWCMKQR